MILAQVFEVLVASPSDVQSARETVAQSIYNWNEANTPNRHVVFLPRLWETSTVPQLGGDAQEVINSQLVDSADIVIAIFGNRLGSETPRALSGTAEEMNRAHQAGKPVHPYFSNEPIPRNTDFSEVKRLDDFKVQLEGLYASYKTHEQLWHLVWRALEHDLAQLQEGSTPTVSSSRGVDFLVQPGSEREPKTDGKGRLKYQTRRWIDLTNRGDRDAYDVEVTPVEDSNFLVHWRGPVTIQHGQSRRIPITYTMTTNQAKITVRWNEDGAAMSRNFDID